jgi:acyl-CoA thioester hydrolase
MSANHSFDLRVYYEDTDAGGIVFYANYLKFAERGRTEMLRSLGLENSRLRAEEGVLLVVRHLEADYTAPARLDDILRVETGLEYMKNTSFAMKQSIFCGERLLFNMTVLIACINLQNRPTRIPDTLRQALEPKA